MEVESTMMSSQLNMKLDFRVRVVDSDGVGLFTESLDVWGGGGGGASLIFFIKRSTLKRVTTQQVLPIAINILKVF